MTKERVEQLGRAGIAHFHQALIQQYGTGTTRALGWRNLEGQWRRLETLSQIGNLSGHSVLDAGCGHADLLALLKKRFTGFTYYGCEQLPELLEVARQRYQGEPSVVLLQGDFLAGTMPVTDFVLASGSLTYRHQEEDFVYQAIETLFGSCRLGLGFNLLSGGVTEEGLLRTYQPDAILAFCRRLSNRVELQVGYWPDDFTVFVYKD